MRKWILALLVLLSLVLTGCSTSAPDNSGIESSENQETNIADMLLGIWMQEGAKMEDSFHFYEDGISMSHLTLGKYEIHQNGTILITPDDGDSLTLNYTMSDGVLHLFEGNIPLVQVAKPDKNSSSDTAATEAAAPATEPDDPTLEPIYQEAAQLREDGKYREAMALYQQLGDYKDSRQCLGDFLSVPSKVTREYQSMGELQTVRLEYSYNNDGSLASAQAVSSNPYYRENYTFFNDEQGNCVKYACVDDDGDTEYEFFAYDIDGNLIRNEYEYGTTEYHYDENGNQVQIDFLDGGEPWYHIYYEYDQAGNVIKELCMWADGDIDSERVWIYDDRGLAVQAIETGADESDGFTSDIVYDEHGKLIKFTRYCNDGTTLIDAYTYDENGDLIEQYNDYDDLLCRYTYSDYKVYYRPGKNNNQSDFLEDWIDAI